MIGAFFRYALPFLVLTAVCYTETISPIEETELPGPVKAALDKHAKKMNLILRTCNDQPNARMGRNVHKMDWLPGYYIKYGVDRFYNAQKLRHIIRTQNLDLISVATKYLYHVPGRPKKISNKNYLVIAKKVLENPADYSQCNQKKGLNLRQAKQLCAVALRAKHYDLHPANYILHKGTVIIVDTDTGAMPSAKKVRKFEKDRLYNGTRMHNKGRTYMHPKTINDPLAKIALGICEKHFHYQDDAEAYITAKVNEREAYFQRNKKRSAFLKFFHLA